MIEFRWPARAFLALTFGCASTMTAQAVEPDGPDKLITRMDATLIDLRDELDGTTKKKPPVSRETAKGLKEYYFEPGAKPLWVGNNGLNRKSAASLKMVFDRADSFGLDPKDYAVVDGSRFAAYSGYPAEWLADAEIRMSAAAVTYASYAEAGRVVPTSIDPESLDLKPARPAPRAVLKSLADAKDIASQLESYNPTQPQFKALKKKLAEARGAIKSGALPVRIPDGPALGPATYHPQIAILRERFSVPPSANAPHGNPAEYYDEALAEAVRAFQESKGLQADGVVGRDTRDALNQGTVAVDVKTLISNMERWRWEPRDLGEKYVFVNIPEFKFRLVSNGKVIHEERIVAGSPQHPTPIFSDEMEEVVFNPYWYVPQSILVKEIIPMVLNNPDYLSRNNLEVIWLGQRTVDPYMVDWYQVNPAKVTLRQTPGTANALGQVKFNFPNKHSVYMHDTPTKYLFDRPVRAYSHGCMRVRNPLKFAKLLLADQGWTDDRIQQTLLTASDDHVKLAKRIPVHIAYFTVWVDENGELRSYRDIYGFDTATKVALKLEPAKVIASKSQEFDAGERGMQN